MCVFLVPSDMVCLTFLTSIHLMKGMESIYDVGAPIRQILLSPVTSDDENND
jgi:hypothetical protein